jgi:hypothetical protein
MLGARIPSFMMFALHVLTLFKRAITYIPNKAYARNPLVVTKLIKFEARLRQRAKQLSNPKLSGEGKNHQ